MSSTPRYISTFSEAASQPVTPRPVARPPNLPSELKLTIDAEDATFFTFCGPTAEERSSTSLTSSATSSTSPTSSETNNNIIPLHEIIFAEVVKEWEQQSYEGWASRTAKEVVYTDVKIIVKAWTQGLEKAVGKEGSRNGDGDGVEGVQEAVCRYRMGKRREYMRFFLGAHQRKAWADLMGYVKSYGGIL